MLVTGEAGIGKTSLLAGALTHARAAGGLVGTGTGWEGEGAPGYWPWVQVVRALRLETEPEVWERAAGEAGAGLDRLLGRGGPTGSEGGAFEIADAVTTLLRVLARDRTVVVALEDLHWADPASIALIGALVAPARLSRVLLLGTYRDDEVASPDHQLHADLAELATRARTLHLLGLDAEACAALLARDGGPDAAALAADVQRRTGGNPFFVQQLMQLWETSGTAGPVPAGVGAVVQRRVARLRAPVADSLQAASLLGLRFDPAVLAAVVGAFAEGQGDGDGSVAAGDVPDRDDVVAHLNEARSAGLVTVDPSGGWHFVHDLVRETLLEVTPAAQRRRGHAAAARALQAAPASSGTVAATELAHHAVLAIPEIPEAEAVDLLLAAAADASGRLAAEEAAGHLLRALELAGPGDRRRAAIRLALGGEQRRAGHLAASRATYGAVLDAAAAHEDSAAYARAALGLHALGTLIHEGAEQHHPLLAEARRRLVADTQLPAPERDALLARVLGAMVRSRVHQTELDRSGLDELSAEAVELARRSGDAPSLAFALLARHDAIWEPATAEARLELTAEMARAARAGADPEMELQALLLEFVARMELGDPDALPTIERYYELEGRLQLPRCRYVALSRRATVATLQGLFDEAERLTGEAHALGERLGEVDNMGVYCDQLWELATQRGDATAVDALLARFKGDSHLRVIEMGGALLRNDRAEMSRLHKEFTDLGVVWPRWARTIWWALEAELAVAGDDAVRCREVRSQLAPLRGRWAVLGGGVIVRGPVDHWLAVLDLELGDLDDAVARFEAARASAERLGARSWVVHARVGLAQALKRRGGPTDDVDAASVIAAATTEAAALGMHQALTKLEALAEAPARPRGRFVRDGDVWTLEYEGIVVRLPDAKGLRDLHTLVRNPGRDIAAGELINPDGSAGEVASRRLGADAVLDDRAKAEYRARLSELDEAIDRALDRGDDGTAQRLDVEREALLGELQAASGLGGRTRRLGDDSERARKAVTGRIRDLLRRLADRHPALARHFEASVATGSSCRYDPAEPVLWET